jgi:hypothetical protein
MTRACAGAQRIAYVGSWASMVALQVSLLTRVSGVLSDVAGLGVIRVYAGIPSSTRWCWMVLAVVATAAGLPSCGSSGTATWRALAAMAAVTGASFVMLDAPLRGRSKGLLLERL